MSQKSAVKPLDFKDGQIVQEFLWDQDVDEALREAVAEQTGNELVDEDYADLVDGAIIWWREDDGEVDDLTDCLVDATQNFAGPGVAWVITPKSALPGHVSPFTIESAAQVAGLHATSSVVVAPDWAGIRVQTRDRA